MRSTTRHDGRPTGSPRSSADFQAVISHGLVLDPANGRRIAKALETKFAQLSAADAGYFAQRYADFDRRLAEAERRWKAALAPYNGTSEPMQKLGRFFRENGLYTFVRWNTFFTNPPLSISEDELRQGFDIIHRGLSSIAPR